MRVRGGARQTQKPGIIEASNGFDAERAIIPVRLKPKLESNATANARDER